MRLNRAVRSDGFALEHAGERPDVAAGHEVLARAADHDDAQSVVGSDVRSGVDQRIHERRVERVERLGTIERKRRDAAFARDEEGGRHWSRGAGKSSMWGSPRHREYSPGRRCVRCRTGAIVQLASQSHKFLERGADAYAIPASCHRHRGGLFRVDRARPGCARSAPRLQRRSRPGLGVRPAVRSRNGHADRHRLFVPHHGGRHLRTGLGLRLSPGQAIHLWSPECNLRFSESVAQLEATIRGWSGRDRPVEYLKGQRIYSSSVRTPLRRLRMLPKS